MSKSIYLLPILFILAIFSCSKDNDMKKDGGENNENYISVNLIQDIGVLNNVVVASYQEEESWKDYISAFEISELEKDVLSTEYILKEEIQLTVGRKYYIFFDHENNKDEAYMISKPYTLQKGIKNTLNFTVSDKKIVVSKKSLLYPFIK